jgi:hypothetical protein
MGRARVPAAVRALDVPERRLAWGLTDDGTVLTATPTALYAGTEPLPWWRIERAAWQPPLLTVVEVADVEGAGTQHTWSLADDARLAETVRACVTSSIGWTDHRKLGDGSRVRLVGRRQPGRDPLEWQTVWSSAAAAADPAWRAQAARWVEELRGSIG